MNWVIMHPSLKKGEQRKRGSLTEKLKQGSSFEVSPEMDRDSMELSGEGGDLVHEATGSSILHLLKK